ncbi:DUF3060 domain-containing protein [Pyxidicoccus caerfyrddinensis]|uniref:DUF3060 domain-containing protein n=1 Tax=Pyxidicoccus caerfyrddinensis TaxID=2709663 RepID=UPI0013DA4201|nr:DUF3060 domain-containing protein [Pyxidicoccus caerfyrddinensis]
MSKNGRSLVLSGLVACLLGSPLVAGAQGSNKAGKDGGTAAQDAAAKAMAPQPGPDASSVQTNAEGRLQISGAMRKEAVSCNAGQGVDIAGTSHDFQLSGECGDVVVSGNNNKVKVETAKAITVMGVGNKVTWKRGEPKQETRGTNNSLTREK